HGVPGVRLDGVAHAFAEVDRGIALSAGENERELLTADAPEEIGRPAKVFEECGAVPQDLVAEGVTESVVDDFEVIEVGDAQGQGMSGGARDLHLGGESL